MSRLLNVLKSFFSLSPFATLKRGEVFRRLAAAVLVSFFVLGLEQVSSTAALADVVIRFENDGSALKMTTSGTITGTPLSVQNTNTPSQANVTSRFITSNTLSKTEFTKRFFVEEATSIFGSMTRLTTSSVSGPNPDYMFLPVTNSLYVRGVGTSRSLDAVAIFPNTSVDALGALLTSIYTLRGTTGGAGGSPDRIIIQVVRPAPL